MRYNSHKGDSVPSEGKILFVVLDSIRNASRKGIEAKSDSDRINKMIVWISRFVMKLLQQEQEKVACCRVSVSDIYTRAYFSHGRNCRYSKNCIYDCQGKFIAGVRKERKVKKGRVCPFSRDGTKIFFVFSCRRIQKQAAGIRNK